MLKRLRFRIWWAVREWQADRDIAAGRVETFDSAEDFIASLDRV